MFQCQSEGHVSVTPSQESSILLAIRSLMCMSQVLHIQRGVRMCNRTRAVGYDHVRKDWVRPGRLNLKYIYSFVTSQVHQRLKI
jgi:hypothetical protein